MDGSCSAADGSPGRSSEVSVRELVRHSQHLVETLKGLHQVDGPSQVEHRVAREQPDPYTGIGVDVTEQVVDLRPACGDFTHDAHPGCVVCPASTTVIGVWQTAQRVA